ncbi:MAG: glycosidase-like protein [Mycobacteriales bacterium]|nr:glycosidase-like protein [Mycobacteriales bacterium]
MTPFITRTDTVLLPDPSRVVARLFVPGLEHVEQGESRATAVIRRTLALSEDAIEATLQRIRDRSAHRHRDLPAVLRRHYAAVAHRVPDEPSLTDARRTMLGAVFTAEASLSGAALLNPSTVAHPDQSGLPDGALRLLLTLRAVGEGHLSCVELRTGVVGPGRALVIDDPGRLAETGTAGPTTHHLSVLTAELERAGADDESTRFLLDLLDEQFDEPELFAALDSLHGQRVTRRGAVHTAEIARTSASASYEVRFDPDCPLTSRVLWPHTPAERSGIEDVRMVRFTDADGVVDYRGTCTAYDGVRIAPQLLETTDFLTFRMSPLAGPSATDKGVALFPRLVGGRHLALTRSDRESICLASSADGRVWDAPEVLHGPSGVWELVQTGNCGSPIETSAGWLVLTHGVGPMREYTLGALLLDLDDPSRVVGILPEPLLLPDEEEREGYVPNVVYTCGAIVHGDDLLLPYGASDASVRFAFVDLPALLERLTTSVSSAE